MRPLLSSWSRAPLTRCRGTVRDDVAAIAIHAGEQLWRGGVLHLASSWYCLWAASRPRF